MTRECIYQEIQKATQRVYAAGDVTPLQILPLKDIEAEVWVKREDLGPIKAYKWRGAFNAMAALSEEERSRGIVAASAGNHAQGIALGARSLGCNAIIFMPRNTPEVKQSEVMRHGGKQVEIRLIGDTYDDAGIAAASYCKEVGAVYVHPYDAAPTMGGQGTVAVELVNQTEVPFDRVYVAVGGGGLVSSVAVWLKEHWKNVEIIAVEGEDQASMKAAVEAGKPVKLDYVDIFCDGTAVRKVGDHTFSLCQQLVDEFVTVSNTEVCNAMRKLWETNRTIPEPSGAMGLAAIYKDQREGKIKPGQKILTIICGANMDFSKLASIAKQAGIGSRKRRYLRVPIPEGKGTLLNFLRSIPPHVSIIDLQYGRLDNPNQYPVVGLLGTEEDYAAMEQDLKNRDINAVDASTEEMVSYRIINYNPSILENPVFVNIEFSERAGAFLEFMDGVKDIASLCYFNYSYSGEGVGRSMVGIEFSSIIDKETGLQKIEAMVGKNIRAVRPVSLEAQQRLTSKD